MDQITPMMRQYMEIKRDNKDTILLFRLGDFYEMFFDDAVVASKILGITLTGRDKGKGEKAPMAGFPFHSAEGYISRLIKAGYRVGICEQVEDPKLAKGLVKREIVRIITPGTVLISSLLEDKASNYLVSVVRDTKSIGLSFIDLSTGEFKLTEVLNKTELIDELNRLLAKECLLPNCLVQEGFLQEFPIIRTSLDDWIFSYENAYSNLIDHFKTQSLDGFGAQNLKIAIGSAGAIIHYLKETQKSALTHISSLSVYNTADFMILDRDTQQNLEITTSLCGEKQNSLLGVLDKTITPMGGRLLRAWLNQPLLNVEKIVNRQQAIAQLMEKGMLRREILDLLSRVYDIERIISRLDCGLANARDLISLKQSLLITPFLKEKISKFDANVLIDIANGLEPLNEVTDLIEQAIIDAPPLSIHDGGLIKSGYNQELDELISISKDGKSWIAALQKHEISRTKISSLKIGYNRVFGYYIEITNPNLHLIPQDYIRKQTLSNAERFITQELKERETMILNAEERLKDLEYNIFLDVRAKIIKSVTRIQMVALSIALLDVLVSLTCVAVENDYVQPEINNGSQIDIKNGRHPVVESILSGRDRFIPNDTLLDSQTDQILIITGPNMAGKSTYIRQVAIIVLMAQIGSFVPASSATIGIVDRIFTRIGASDALAKGQSTFMVEMNEVANILNNTTSKGLIILDEVGRGTSTFDGLSIAWSVVEYLHNHKESQAKTLFATHYHELTELEFSLDRVRNYNIAVKEWQDNIIFLHKIIKGSADRSYGIHVARLAGLPDKVIKRAGEILSDLEFRSITEQEIAKSQLKPTQADPVQLSLFFAQPYSEVIERLKKMDVNTITPVEALIKLVELKKIADNVD